MTTPWTWAVIDGWKSHALPTYLLHSIIDDLTARANAEGAPDEPRTLAYSEQSIASVYIDEPGLVGGIVGRPIMSFQIDGLTVEIPCHDVGVFMGQLKRAKRRTFTVGKSLGVGMDYYKLHGMHGCIVLTPDLRAELLMKMEAMHDEAERLADLHVAQWKVEVDLKKNGPPKAKA